MSDLITLRDPIDLIPVLELEPWSYARPGRSSPGRVEPEILHEYWKASLEDFRPPDIGVAIFVRFFAITAMA